MADRSQNITINYKFNTAEIDRANAVLNRANQATNTLQAAGQKAGQQIASGFQKATPAIESMRIQLARLKTQIEVSSDPKRVAELSNQYKTLKAQLDAATKSAFDNSKAMKATSQATQSLSSQFGNLYQAAKLLVTAGIVREVLNIGLEMASLKGNVEGVERAFARAFPNQVKLLNDLRTATRGTVTDFELMQRTLQATNLGVSVEQLPVLFEFAAARAQQTGESVDYLVDSIVRGIGRKSPLILDNLGLSAIRLKEKFDGAALASQSVADVTQGVAEIAREELEKMGGYAENTATQVGQLKTSWEELRIELAKKIESGGIISFLDDSLQGLRDLIKGNKAVSEEFLRSIGAEQAARVKESQTFKQAGTDRQKQFDIIQQEINTRTELISKTKDSITAKREEANVLINEFRVGNQSAINGIKDQIGVLQQRNFIQAAAILALKEYLAELQKLGSVEPEFETIDKLQEKLKELKRQREEDTFTGNTAELDRLQREIILLEDRILKISDNIAWQKQWDHSKMESALATETETENLKKFNDELDKLTDRLAGGDISFSTGDLLNPDRDAKEVIDIDAIEESLKEVVELADVTVDGVNRKFTSFETFVIRFRLALQGKGGETSDLQQGINDAVDDLKTTLVDGLADQFASIAQHEADSLKLRLRNLQKFYQEQQILAGDNERRKTDLRIKEARETDALRNQIARKEKQARRTQILIDIAAGVGKALATYPWPYSLIVGAIVAAQGLSQLAIVNRQPTNFAKGVIDLKGPGTETSDSIPANLSRGESVMTAWETRHAGDVLKDIRAKKLDNKVLKSLKQGREPIAAGQNFDDGRIIKAIEKNRPPDVIVQSGIVYEARKSSEDYIKKVRAKSVRI